VGGVYFNDDWWTLCWLLVWRRVIKEDECRRIKYEGENIDDYDGIFCFEAEDEEKRAWTV
jgi:hypothetical protein